MAKKKKETSLVYSKPSDIYINFFTLYTDTGINSGGDEPLFLVDDTDKEPFKEKYYKFNNDLLEYYNDISFSKSSKTTYTDALNNPMPAKNFALVVPRNKDGTKRVSIIDESNTYLNSYGNIKNFEDPPAITIGTQYLKDLYNNAIKNLRTAEERALEGLKNNSLDSKDAAIISTRFDSITNNYESLRDEDVKGDLTDNDAYIKYKFGIDYGLESVLIAAAENV